MKMYSRCLFLVLIITLTLGVGCKSDSNAEPNKTPTQPLNSTQTPIVIELGSPTQAPIPELPNDTDPLDFPPISSFIPEETFVIPEFPPPPSSITNSESPDIKTGIYVVGFTEDIDLYTTNYVCDGIDDQIEIQAAIDAANPDGEKVILVGTFTVTDSIRVPDNVTLQGLPSDIAVYLADGATGPVIMNSDPTNGNRNITVRDVWIDGNRVNAGTYSKGIEFRNVSNSSIVNCWVQNTKGGSKPYEYGIGISISQSTDITVEGCFATDNGNEGIGIRNACKDIVVKKNQCWVNHAEGIMIAGEGGHGEACSDILLDNNLIFDQNKCGIRISAESNAMPHTRISIIGNTLNNNGGGLGFISDGEAFDGYYTISDNDIYNTLGKAVETYKIGNLSIIDNLILDSGDEGMRINHSPHSIVKGNKVKNTKLAIYIIQSPFSSIDSNVLTHNDENGIRIYSSDNSSITENLIIDNNQIRTNYDAIFCSESVGLSIERNRMHYGHDRAIELTKSTIDCTIQNNDVRYYSQGLSWWDRNRPTGDGTIPIDNYGTDLLVLNNIGFSDETEIQDTLNNIKTVMGEPRGLWPFSQLSHTLPAFPKDYSDKKHDLEPRGGGVLYWDALVGFKGKACYYTFNGEDENLYYSDHDDFSFGNGSIDSSFGIMAVIRPDVSELYPMTILGKYNEGSPKNREWVLRINSDRCLEFELFDESADAYIGKTGTVPITTDKWEILVVSYDGKGSSDGITMYQNGVPINGVNKQGGTYEAMENLYGALRIGCNEKGEYTTDNHYKGSMTWVGIMGNEMSYDEVSLCTQNIQEVLASPD